MYGGYDDGDLDIDIDGMDSSGNYTGCTYDGYTPVEYTPHHQVTESYQYKFEDKEDLLQSDVFQECLRQSLAFKDIIIKGLQNELLKYLKA